MLARLTATDTPAAEEAPRQHRPLLRDRPPPVRAARRRPGRFLVPHLATLIEAGDDPATADLDPDLDAVAVLTVHKAKGLEFPVVFLPGLVAGRFPSSGRGDPLALPAGLGRGGPATPELALAEERRLFYVAMTRARDELILSPRRGLRRRPRPTRLAVRARGAGPAVDRGHARRRRRGAGAIERLAAFEAQRPPTARPRGPIDEPLSLSFYQIDDYLTCPLKYKYAHVLRVPLAPHHAIIYGAALHKAVQLFHQRHAKGQVMTEAELDERPSTLAWSNEGFVSRDHEEARLEAGRAALRRFRAAQLEPDAVIPTYVEREFSFSLGGDRVRGRWDRVDVVPIAGGERPGRRLDGASADASADVVSPTLGIIGPRARDHHGLQVLRRPRPGQGPAAGPRLAPAPDLRDGLRGHDRPPAGCRRAPLPRLGARGSVAWIRSAGQGEGEDRDRRPRGCAPATTRRRSPARLACSYCAFRDICPASVARLTDPRLGGDGGARPADQPRVPRRRRRRVAARLVRRSTRAIRSSTRAPGSSAPRSSASRSGSPSSRSSGSAVFARHRRIAYQGDWTRAVRRAAWVGLIVTVLVVLRLQGVLEWPIALFMIILALVAESTLSAER